MPVGIDDLFALAFILKDPVGIVTWTCRYFPDVD